MASWGSYVFELCRINANQGLTAEIDWNYTSWSRRCRKILIGLVVRGAKTVVVRGKNRILTRNRNKPEMTVPISKPQKTRNDSSYQSLRLWPAIFSGEIDVFPGDRRSRLISSMTSVAPA